MTLSDAHLEILAGSGISEEFARRRGYESITEPNPKRLAEMNFVKAVRNHTGLLIPLLRVDGSTWGWQFKSDTPRVLETGKVRKYEIPYEQHGGIDFPPGVAEMVADPNVPLLITEGIKKGDCAAERGLCIVALIGVWNFVGTNTYGGKGVALADWRDIPLNGRRCIVGFDSDTARNEKVQQAAAELAKYVAIKGAKAEYLWLPDGDEKTGLDDYLVSHPVEELMRLVKPTQPKPRIQAGSPDSPRLKRGPAVTGSTAITACTGSIERGTEPVDGAQLLDDLVAWWRRFIAVTNPDDLDLLALWTVHTHLVRECYTSPRLLIDSIMEGSGKSTVIDHLNRLCVHPVQAATITSPALIPRLLEGGMRTILIDEAHRALRPDRPGVQDLIGIINTGYRYGATRPVLIPTKGGGWDADEMTTFAPLAMAGNNPNLPADTISRQIRVLLMPDINGTVEDSDWEHIENEANALKARIAEWADAVRDDVRGITVDLPDGCIGRFKEKWRPLARVARVAGGDWPTIAYRLIDADMQQDAAEREAGLKTLPPGMVMMNDLFAVWPADETFMSSRELVRKLIFHNPEYWGSDSPYGKPLTEHRLGRLVFQASKMSSNRPGGRGPRGYLRMNLEPVWHHLGIGPIQTGASGYTGETGYDDGRCNRCDKPLTAPESIARGYCEECHVDGFGGGSS